ncbi:DUF4238 domain-containing protein [Burkholderia vietnamiensis]|uniref:DUF4238 domain-containing protein n=1 Tax=Burkholderia vietnamiensis TaxID=60552 RepID=UPI001B8EC5FE|nr:DUF4238 domain-containing protein [Burkholderia vietnamiensis]MBR7919019.1 DUF4238 domain-containing protein [Burkholderia vietnamiensis]
MNKRRHHHVWQHYLKPWEVDKKIMCLSSGSIFRTGTINVAVDRDFYALKKLSKQDMWFATALISGAKHDEARKSQLHFLKRLTDPSMLEGISPALDDEIHKFRINVLEDWHTKIEHAFIPLLKRAMNSDIEFYLDDEGCIPFLHYLCTQNMRTKGVQERLLAANTRSGMPDISRIWPILALTFAENVGAALYVERRRRKLVLVRNATGVPFITGDQPVANLLALSDDVPEHLALYYPISPELALILNEVDDELPLATETLTIEQVRGLNAKLASGCHSQLFGTSEEALRSAQRDPVWVPDHR